ncbi:MAG: hypothetical protein ACXVCV_05295, partial [Polyangia bacterium]
MRSRTYIVSGAAIALAIAYGRCANHIDTNDGGGGGGDCDAGCPAPDLATHLTVDDLPKQQPPLVYVSGYSTTIARYTLDLANGALTAAGTTTVTGSPSFLAVDWPRL